MFKYFTRKTFKSNMFLKKMENKICSKELEVEWGTVHFFIQSQFFRT
jgi:hypothetical protein